MRVAALGVLDWLPSNNVELVLPWLNKGDASIKMAAARYLRGRARTVEQQGRVERLWIDIKDDEHQQSLAEQLAILIFAEDASEFPKKPVNDAAWFEAVMHGGRPDLGEQVFFSKIAQCSTCHTHSLRGGAYGPDLTHVGASKDREQLLRSIPSSGC